MVDVGGFSIALFDFCGSTVPLKHMYELSGYAHLRISVLLSSQGQPSTISSSIPRTVPDHISESV